MFFDSFLSALQDRDVMQPLLCSLIAGALIGTERELNRKPAGIRTHALLCFAAALMTLLGLRMAEWVAVLPPGTEVVSDMSRMPHAILTGMGFLGAGVIFREGASVQGLTTAASLWLTAALGVVFGTGLIGLGMVGTLIALLVLLALRLFQRLAPPPPFARLAVTVPAASALTARGLRDMLVSGGLIPDPIALRLDAGEGLRTYETQIAQRGEAHGADELAALLSSTEEQRSITFQPLTLPPAPR